VPIANQAAAAVTDVSDRAVNDLQGLFEDAQRLLRAGRAYEALTTLRDILGSCPNHPDALNFASVAFGQLDMTDEAIKFSRQAVAARPTDAGFHLNLANRLNDQGHVDEALAGYEQALAIDPNHRATLKSRLRCLAAEDRWSEAEDVADRLAALSVDDADVLAECGEVCIGADNKRRALKFYRSALDIEPDRLSWLLQTARLAITLNDVELATTCGERVLEQEEHPEMRAMLASIMHRIGDYAAVLEHLEAIPEDSDQAANAANLMGMMLVGQGKTREGIDAMARTAVLAPDTFALQATRAMYSNYDPAMSTAALRDVHLAVGRHFARALPEIGGTDLALPHDPERRLRIGFVSPDFRAHSVAYFTQPYFRAFNRDHFEVFAYAHVANEDMVSLCLRESVTSWQNVFSMSDNALAEQIRQDRIDILIDLAGLTRDTRLLAFTARPAPIQMSYIGYPNTTGLPAIDYRITDGIADPDDADDDYSETLIRVPGCFLCYAIPDHAPPVEPGPAEHRDYVTFGSFNNFAKVNPEVVAAWADVLKAVPGSRMICKSTASTDPTAQSVVRLSFEAAGVDPSRVSFSSFRHTPESHLAVYNDIDIALDTFPYNGTTTTCEALWMGVPVITLRGDRHAGRVGASLLQAIGFPAGITESREDYVLTARLLAESRGLLKTLRRSLRETVRNSPLCDSQRHAETLEQGFRAVWQMWCEQQTPTAVDNGTSNLQAPSRRSS